MKAFAKKVARRVGYDVRRAAPNVVDFINSRNVDVVLDVGANVGQFGRELRERGYRGQIVSFEPVTPVFEELRKAAERDHAWEVRNLALGASHGTATIKVSENTVFSSILKQTPVGEAYDAKARVLREETIRVERLDDLFEPFRGRRVFLKIDTQGFERDVLLGAEASLKHVVGLQAELPTGHLYEGVWTLPEALEFLMRRGFILAQTHPINYGANDPVSLIEMDCVFRVAEDGSRAG